MDLNVACVKWGTKFPADYVNRLRAMVRRNLPLPHRFVCLTDDPAGLASGIEPLGLRGGLEYCWNKLELFRPGLFSGDDICLYFDLDVVITGPIDALLSFRPQDVFVGLYDWYRSRVPHYNSSVMRFQGGRHETLYTSLGEKLAAGRVRWAREYDAYLGSNDKVVLWEDETRYGGDQEWISRYVYAPRELKEHSFPGGWLLSYRKHGRRELPRGCKVMVFHGDPKPHEVENDYVREHWR
ncbi:MAG TPA: hypothetical protein P5567_15425 [Kiritimatiellia bacterium]|nr:hypothetical protein [Kiritimatiellia bacterium]HRZ13833.1 hypothetical protein [Kiritimatiellia bacterium]HSA19454.1 hypothetical protein [Kiritimatiellia bacterium]